MKTVAELRIVCDNECETERKEEETTTEIYNSMNYYDIINDIEKIRSIINDFSKVDDNACFTRKELNRQVTISPQEFVAFGIKPSFKEPFQISVDGRKITVYRYYYSKQKVLEILNKRKERLKIKMFECGAYDLDDMISRAEYDYEQIKTKLEQLRNRKRQAIQFLNKIGELEI